MTPAASSPRRRGSVRRFLFTIALLFFFAHSVSAQMAYDTHSLRALATRGDADAQFNMGKAAEHNKDYEGAVGWFKKSADQGNPSAQTYLGFYYSEGKGVKQDLSEAFGWFRKAAEQGNLFAQYRTGTAYENGDGVQKNLSEAYFWYRMASDFDDRYANFAEKIAPALTPEQVQSINQRVTKKLAEYVPVSHFDLVEISDSGAWHSAGSKVIIHGDGRVEYDYTNVIVAPKPDDLQLTQAQMNEVIAAINDSKYFQIPDDYNDFGAACGMYRTDFPYLFTSVTVDGKTHSVFHYLGCDAGPQRLTSFEGKVQKITSERRKWGPFDVLDLRQIFKFDGPLALGIFWPSLFIAFLVITYLSYRKFHSSPLPKHGVFISLGVIIYAVYIAGIALRIAAGALHITPKSLWDVAFYATFLAGILFMFAKARPTISRPSFWEKCYASRLFPHSRTEQAFAVIACLSTAATLGIIAALVNKAGAWAWQFIFVMWFGLLPLAIPLGLYWGIMRMHKNARSLGVAIALLCLFGIIGLFSLVNFAS